MATGSSDRQPNDRLHAQEVREALTRLLDLLADQVAERLHRVYDGGSNQQGPNTGEESRDC